MLVRQFESGEYFRNKPFILFVTAAQCKPEETLINNQYCIKVVTGQRVGDISGWCDSENGMELLVYNDVEISQALAARQPEDQWIFRADWQDHDYQARLRGASNH